MDKLYLAGFVAVVIAMNWFIATRGLAWFERQVERPWGKSDWVWLIVMVGAVIAAYFLGS